MDERYDSVSYCLQLGLLFWFAVEVAKPELVPKIIENFKKCILGFHLKLEDSKMVYNNDPINVYSIPQNVRGPRQACNFIDSIKYDLKNTFSVIAANDKTVAVSVSHIISDGGFFIDLFEKLLMDNTGNLKSLLPLTTIDVLPDELSRIPKQYIEEASHAFDNMTKFKYSKNYKELQKIPGIKLMSKHYNDESPVTDFQFYKEKMNLHDLCMTSYLISILSLNGQLDSIFGIYIPVNLRRYMPQNEKNFSNGQNWSAAIVNAFDVSPKTAIRQLSNILQNDLTDKLNKRQPLAIYQCYLNNNMKFKQKNWWFPEFSNIGRFKSDLYRYDELINDMWIQTAAYHPDEEDIFIIGFSKMKNGQNTICSRFRHPCAILNDTDAKLLMKSFVRMMKEVPVDVTIQDAYDDISRFQNKIKNEL